MESVHKSIYYADQEKELKIISKNPYIKKISPTISIQNY